MDSTRLVRFSKPKCFELLKSFNEKGFENISRIGESLDFQMNDRRHCNAGPSSLDAHWSSRGRFWTCAALQDEAIHFEMLISPLSDLKHWTSSCHLWLLGPQTCPVKLLSDHRRRHVCGIF